MAQNQFIFIKIPYMQTIALTKIPLCAFLALLNFPPTSIPKNSKFSIPNIGKPVLPNTPLTSMLTR